MLPRKLRRKGGTVVADITAVDWASIERDDKEAPLFFIEPHDALGLSEHKRQVAFVSWMRVHAPGVKVVASANGFLTTDWQRTKAKREGMDGGAADLAIYWNHGCFLPEFKDGTAPVPQHQIDWLNWMHRAGFRVGVYRTRATLIAHLIEAGAPIVGEVPA